MAKKNRKQKNKEIEEESVSQEQRIIPKWMTRIHLENLRNEYFRCKDDPHAYRSWIADNVVPYLKKMSFHLREDGSNIAYVSKKALEKAEELGIKKQDILSGNYRACDLTKYDKGHKQLMHEHVVPIKEIVSAIENASEFENMNDVIDMIEIALITKEEDKALTQNGFQSSRPNGWRNCYRSCGIEILAIPYKTNALGCK